MIFILDCSTSIVRDVVFVIDTSRFISYRSSTFQLVRELIENITTSIKVNSPETLFGLITFDNTARLEFNITRHTDLSTLLPAINPGLRFYQGSNTNIASGLNLLLYGFAEDGLLQLRNGTSKVAIVITDYNNDFEYRYYSNSFSSLQSAANSLHAANVYDVYAIGIDNNNYNELQLIASNPSFVFSTYYLDYFTAQVLVDGVVEQLCSSK